MTADAFRQRLEAISADFRRAMPGKLAGIERLWAELADGSAAAGRMVDLQRELHALAGSARTLGVAGVSEAAGAAEAWLEPYCAKGVMPPAARRGRFGRLLANLKRRAREGAR